MVKSKKEKNERKLWIEKSQASYNMRVFLHFIIVMAFAWAFILIYFGSMMKRTFAWDSIMNISQPALFYDDTEHDFSDEQRYKIWVPLLGCLLTFFVFIYDIFFHLNKSVDCRENLDAFVLGLYYLLLFIIFTIITSTSVLFRSMTTFRNVEVLMKKELTFGFDQSHNISAKWESTQNNFKCCGVHGRGDWILELSGIENENLMLPASCCPSPFINASINGDSGPRDKYDTSLCKFSDGWNKGCLGPIKNIILNWTFIELFLLLGSCILIIGYFYYLLININISQKLKLGRNNEVIMWPLYPSQSSSLSDSDYESSSSSSEDCENNICKCKNELAQKSPKLSQCQSQSQFQELEKEDYAKIEKE